MRARGGNARAKARGQGAVEEASPSAGVMRGQTDHANAQEDPRGGMGAKASGSHAGGRGVRGRSLNTPSTYTPIPERTSAPDGELAVYPRSGVFADGSPAKMDVSPADIGVAPVQMNAYRRPSMKNVGRDEEGKTIQHHYSKEVESRVAMWMASGADENFICCMLNMRPGTLKELYGHAMENGPMAVNMNVAAAAYRDALQPGAHAAQKFWLKARAGWRDGEQAAVSASPLNIIIHS